MTFNEFVVETIVEHILHHDYMDLLRDLGDEVFDNDIMILHRVDGAIKRNNLEIYY
jgi:hypothetical protein